MASISRSGTPLFAAASAGVSEQPVDPQAWVRDELEMLRRKMERLEPGETKASVFRRDIEPRIRSAMESLKRRTVEGLYWEAEYMSQAVTLFLDEAKKKGQLPHSRSTDSIPGAPSLATIEGLVHELRGDLAPILFTLSDESSPPHEHIEDLQEHYMNLASEIKDIPSPGEPIQIEIDEKPFDIAEFARRTLAAVRPLLKRFDINASFSLEGYISRGVIGDRFRIRQVLKNFIINACNHAEARKIKLIIRIDGSNLEFAVKDNGKGIPKSKQSELFQLFSQLTPEAPSCFPCLYKAKPKKLPSSGVGLSFCKTVAEKMHPTSSAPIGVRSNPRWYQRKAGSEFYVQIPYQPVELRVDRLAPPTPPVPASAQSSPGPKGNERRLLLVDDNALNRTIVKKMLHHSPFEVTEADGSTTALKLIQTDGPFEVILLDVSMPNGMDGPETAAHIHRLGLKTIPRILFLSGQKIEQTQEEIVKANLDLKCFTVLTKPCNKLVLWKELGLTAPSAAARASSE